MDNDFKDVMSKRTDKELIKIVTVSRNGYQPLAIEAAEEEIRKRNIDSTKIEEIKSDLIIKIEKQNQFETEKVSILSRFIHLIVDSTAFIILTIILISVVGLFITPSSQTQMLILVYLIFATAFLGYYIFMETKYQKTIGKFITKTKVVNKDGGKPELKDIVRRTFCRLIPFDRISFLFTPNGFHDRISDTIIIKDEN